MLELWRWVQNDHINAFGILHGGHMLKWVDEDTTMMAFNCCKPGTMLTTAGFDRSSFLAPCKRGDRLNFVYTIGHVGRSSITIIARVYRHPTIPDQGKIELAFRSLVSLACIDEKGHPIPVQDRLLDWAIEAKTKCEVGSHEDNQRWCWISKLREQRKSDPW